MFLFWGPPAWQGFAVADFSSPGLLAVIVAVVLFCAVLGNLRPDTVRGVIERGTYGVGDSIAQLPWRPDGPIALDVTWMREAASALDTEGDADAVAPAPGSAAAVR